MLIKSASEVGQLLLHIKTEQLIGHLTVKRIADTDSRKFDILLEREDGTTFQYEYLQKDQISDPVLYKAHAISVQYEDILEKQKFKCLDGSIELLVPFEGGQYVMPITGIRYAKDYEWFLTNY